MVPDFVLLTKEAYEKFLQDIDAQIKALDHEMKNRADNALQAVYDNYRKTLLDRISNELALAEQARIKHDDVTASRHMALANIFNSILENHVLYGPVANTSFAQDSPTQ